MLGAGKIKTTSLFLLILLSLPCAGFIKKIKTPGTVFFDASDVRQSASYQKVLKAAEKNLEKAKWQYLLDRIRKSPAKFVRNGEVFEGKKAARHLLWKLTRNGRNVKTAKEFVDTIASNSFSSGSPYLVKISEEESYPLRDLMTNELRRLEFFLSEDRK